MGMDLCGAGGEFHFTIWSWTKLLQLAALYGWKPAGTAKPDLGPDMDVVCADCWTPDGPKGPCDHWGGGYMSNDYQKVTHADALNLADALERALPDIPAHDCEPREGSRLIESGEWEDFSEHAAPREFFAGRKDRVRAFIRYCRAGEFVIG